MGWGWGVGVQGAGHRIIDSRHNSPNNNRTCTGQLATNILPTQKPPLGERTVVGRCGGGRLP